MMLKTLAVTIALLATTQAQAVVITQWNFNSLTPDGLTSTGTTAPSIGAGTASLVGGTTATFASGDASGGSSDPALGDDSGWNLTNFAAQGTGDRTRGAQFWFSSVGYQDLSFTYDLRHSNTSARTEVVQYSTDGIRWVDIATFSLNAGDTWAKGRNVDLSAIEATDNNPSFGLRVVAAFDSAAAYLASNPTSNYGSAGTWRFDMVSLNGHIMTAVPEPGAYALWLLGLSALGLQARRRRRA